MAQPKSIDEFVDYIIANVPIVTYKNVYEYILINEISIIESILKSKTNIPSKHDLLLIQAIHKNNHSWSRCIMMKEYWGIMAKSILSFYKNRKDSYNENTKKV